MERSVTEITSNTADDLEALLLAELADDLLGTGLGIGPSDVAERLAFARQWFDDWLERNREELCNSPAIVMLLSDSNMAKSIEDVATIADVVATLAEVPPIVTVSRILAVRGLNRICS
jgi:hypothetical protein